MNVLNECPLGCIFFFLVVLRGMWDLSSLLDFHEIKSKIPVNFKKIYRDQY